MHACFHGSGKTRSIRDLAKNMKALSLKVGGSGSHARARRRGRRGRRAEAEEPKLEMQDKDIAAAAAAASTSAKIAPAQGHETDEDGDTHRPPEEERRRKRQTHCDKYRSRLDNVADEEEDEDEDEDEVEEAVAEEESDREWVAEPEPGVLMTLVSRPDGTNHLRRLRFRKELFDGPRAAQRWWADNYDGIVELYSIVQSNGHEDAEEDVEDFEDEPVTPCHSEDDHHQPRRWQRLGCDSASTSGPSSGSGSGGGGSDRASTQGSPIMGLVVAKPKGSRRNRPTMPAQSHVN